MSENLKSANTVGPARRPVAASAPLSAASDPNPYEFWVSYAQNTGETEIRKGIVYKKLIMYSSFAFDVLNGVTVGTSTYDKIQYMYSASMYGTFAEAITENSEVVWNFTGGTTADNSGAPTYTDKGITYTALYTVKSNVYIPAEECATQAFLYSNLQTTGDVFNKNLFVYKRKGSLKSSDMVITGYGVVQSDNVVDSTFGTNDLDVTKASTPVTTMSTTAAAVAARVNQRASITATSEDGVYTLTQAN